MGLYTCVVYRDPPAIPRDTCGVDVEECGKFNGRPTLWRLIARVGEVMYLH